MNRIKQVLTVGVVALSLLCACNDLDIPPLNVLGDPYIFTSEDGITAYMAQMYSELPIEQFHSGTLRRASSMVYSGEVVTNKDQAYGHTVSGTSFHNIGDYLGAVWNYEKIRRINYFLKTLPDYAAQHPAASISMWTAEARFIRAFYYFEMAKRFGGVPIVQEVTNYPGQTIEELKVPRNKEAEVYDFVIRDLNEAVRLFSEDPSTRIRGRANWWTAQALKARVALHAGSLAVFGPRYYGGHMFRDGICGVPTDRAAYFFNIACEAADSVIRSGHYQLYRNLWSADPKAQEENFVQIFLDQTSNSETMFAVYYKPFNNAHMFDTNNRPTQVNGADYNDKASPTVEMLERYEYVNGQPFRIDANLVGTDSQPKFYANTLDIFKGVEPRLHASIILPGSEYMGEEIEIRYGILPAGKTQIVNRDIMTSGSLTEAYEAGGKRMNIAGKSGIGYHASTVSGFYVRKFQDPALDKTLVMNHIHGSTTPWPEIRYAEVLLIFAEAAVELKELGAAGADERLRKAGEYIDDIRSRAGAFNRNFGGTGALTRADVRSERRRELFFENKTYWDMVRWRVAHEEIDMKRWNLLFPVYCWDEGKYYMKRDSMGDGFRKDFNPRFYYQSIPGTAARSNEKLVGNPYTDY
jgi:hypothetical protein